jgi:hypothetical protein
MNYIGICAIARDENYFIKDWIQFHVLAGVEKFIIYDNESKTPLRETLAEYIECGLVQLYEIKGISPQQQAYQHCLDNHGCEFRWLAFIDIDEFIVLKKNENIHSLLVSYENYAALAINWVMFGSSGYINNPPVPITLHLKELVAYKMPNSTIKSIVQPRYVERANLSPHFFSYVAGRNAVNEFYIPVHGNNSPVSTELIQLNHYIYRGQREYQNKVDRWHYNHDDLPHENLWEDFFRHISYKKEPDESVALFASKLARLMKLSRVEVFSELNNHGLESKKLYEIIDSVSEAIDRKYYDFALKLIVMAEMLHPDHLELTQLKAETLLLKGEAEKSIAVVQNILKDRFWWEGYIILYYCYKYTGNIKLCSGLKYYLKDLIKVAEKQSAEVPESVMALFKDNSLQN